MGLTICPQHGYQEVVDMCVHLWDGLTQGAVGRVHVLPVCDVKICDGCHERLAVQDMRDITLAELMELPDAESRALEEWVVAAYNQIERRGQCVACFDQMLLDEARRNGKPLPFEPFEQTLTYLDRDRIDQLKQELRARFKFRPSTLPHHRGEAAFRCRYGTISKPFEIVVYYVTEPAEQAQLLDVLAQLFHTIPRQQRVVRFYEAENWIERVVAGGVSGHQGAERLLREAWVR